MTLCSRTGRAAALLAVAAVAGALLVPAAGAVGTGAVVVAPVALRSGSLRVSPDLPVVGARVTVDALETEHLRGVVPARATLDLASPTGVHRRVTLVRVGPGAMRATTHFADEGLWTLRVTSATVDAVTDVLVLQNGAVVPAPKPLLVPRLGLGGGLQVGPGAGR